MQPTGHIQRGLFLDAHVHLYPMQDADRMLRGLLRYAKPWLPDGAVGLVALARQGLPDAWEHWRRQDAARAGWQISPVTGDGRALDAVSDAGRVRIYTGRQIVCAERLEVAAIGVSDAIPDGLCLTETLDRVAAASGYPVLAWGVGKWFGARGRRVRDWVEQATAASGALGDSAMRPLGWPIPGVMRLARQRGIPVLGGSDPMPRAEDAASVGRYATWIDLPSLGPPDTAGLIRCLCDSSRPPRTVGRRSGPLSFCLRQTTAWRKSCTN
jgi:hypothetical protein